MDAPNPIPARDPTSMAFNVEAVRGFLFSAGLEIAQGMKEADIPNADAALLTGALEMSVQLWAQVMRQAGHTPRASRLSLEKQMREFHRKHWAVAPEAVAS